MRDKQARPRVLVVEDESPIRDGVVTALSDEGCVVEGRADGSTLGADLTGFRPDLVVLDVMLPGRDGLALAGDVRRAGDAGIVVLTARDAVPDRLAGFGAGADDYLVKPYDPGELLARLRAIERRRGNDAPVLHLGTLEIDLARDMVRKAGAPVVLTSKEWALLRVMASRPDRIHTRETLQDALYGFDSETDSNTLEVFVSRLRRKLGREYIQTLRGLGYRLAYAPEDAA